MAKFKTIIDKKNSNKFFLELTEKGYIDFSINTTYSDQETEFVIEFKNNEIEDIKNLCEDFQKRQNIIIMESIDKKTHVTTIFIVAGVSFILGLLASYFLI